MAPPGSFIHASDFDYDKKKLAEYLNHVSTDFELYKKYFEWKKLYKSMFVAHSVEQIRMCELCFRMNRHEQVGYYTSVSGFFNVDCQRNY